MKKFTILKTAILFLAFLGGFNNIKATEVKIIDENIQSWKTIASYGDGEQIIPVGNGEGTVTLNQVTIVKSKLPDNIDAAGDCSPGYIQMTNNRTPASSIKLPTIPGGVSKIELNIVTSSTAARTVDIQIEEDNSFKTTLSGLSKTGNTYSSAIGTTGNTTIIITNVTGGPIYITDINVYQNQTPGEISNNASLASLSYKIDNNAAISLPDFSSDKLIYEVQLPAGTTNLPIVSATTEQKDATVAINQLTSLPGSAFINVKASDNLTSKTYQINFSVATTLSVTAILPLNISGTATDNALQNFAGFTGNNLGSPASDGGARFEGSKATTESKPALTLAYDTPASKLTFDVKGSNSGSPLGFEGVVFVVEESTDNVFYTQLADLSSDLSVSTKYKTLGEYTVKPESRFIRWKYENSTKGNIALNNIVLTKSGTAIKSIDVNENPIFVQNGNIYITAKSDEQIEIFNLTGQKIKSFYAEEGVNTISLDDNIQFVIIKIGEKTIKTCIR